MTSDALRRATLAHRRGDLNAAVDGYRAALRSDPDQVYALRLLGVCERQRGDLGASRELLQRATGLAPDDADVSNDLALTWLASGDLQRAETALRDALRSAPGSPRALANLGALLQQRGHLEAAIAACRDYLDLEPDDAEVRCNLANALLEAGDADAAVAECDALLEQAPAFSPALATKGSILCGAGRLEEAAAVLEQALELEPGDDMALVNLAYARRGLGDNAAAEELLTRAVRLNANNARASADLADVLLAGRRAAEAMAVCERFLQRHPGERLVLASYVFALRDAGRFEDARRINDYERLVTITGIDAPAGYASVAEFNAELATFVTTHPTLLDDPVRKGTRGGAQTGEFDPLETPVSGALDAALRAAVGGVIERFGAAGLAAHPAMALASERWTLRTWGSVLRPGGRQLPHQHPLGWLSGVYYVQLPDSASTGDSGNGGQGALEFGAPPARIEPREPPVLYPVEPRPGRLVIFPSWFYHRTLPFERGGTRISIAFDVMPLY